MDGASVFTDSKEYMRRYAKFRHKLLKESSMEEEALKVVNIAGIDYAVELLDE